MQLGELVGVLGVGRLPGRPPGGVVLLSAAKHERIVQFDPPGHEFIQRRAAGDGHGEFAAQPLHVVLVGGLVEALCRRAEDVDVRLETISRGDQREVVSLGDRHDRADVQAAGEREDFVDEGRVARRQGKRPCAGGVSAVGGLAVGAADDGVHVEPGPAERADDPQADLRVADDGEHAPVRGRRTES